MNSRNSLEENFSFARIYIGIDPLGPCCQGNPVCLHAIHVLDQILTNLKIVPSATKNQGTRIKISLFHRISKSFSIIPVEYKTVRMKSSCVYPPVVAVENQNVNPFPVLSST